MDSDGLCQGIEIREDSVNFTNSTLASDSYPQFGEIRKQGKLCDVTLKVDDMQFSAHKVVLAAAVPYFNAMFTNGMVESSQKEIKMQGVHPQALEALIHYAYSGSLCISSHSVQNLLQAASFLQLQAVKEACADFLRERLSATNCLAVRSFADQFACTSLIEAANKFVQKHFSDVISTEDFLLLSGEEVQAIIEWDHLYATEEQIFCAVMRWVRREPDTRKELLRELLVRVRLPLLSPQFLSDTVAAEELVKADLSCRDLLDEARDYHLMPERRPQLTSFKTRPRCCTDMFGFIYAVGGLTSSGDSLSTVECFDPTIGKWQKAEAMSTIRSRVGVAVLNGQLYAIGGYDGQERLSTVEVFDPELWKWKKVAPMNCKRSAVGAVATDERLFVCGGYDGVSSLNSVECYDPKKSESPWSMCEPMQRYRSAAGVTLFDGCIFALGGHDGLSIFDSVESYDVRKGKWSMMAPMQTKRCRLGTAALNGLLYAAGGYDGAVFLKSCEVYDPVTAQWTYIKPMQKKRSRVALVANCGKVFAIGGYDGVTNLTSVECYNPDTKEWTFAPEMVAHEGGVGVGVVPIKR